MKLVQGVSRICLRPETVSGVVVHGNQFNDTCKLKYGLLEGAALIVTHRNISAQHFFVFVVRHQSLPFSSAFAAPCGRNYSRQRRRQVDEYPYIRP